MGFQTLELRIESSLAIITLNRPKALNAINLTMVGELEPAVHQVRDDPSVRVVVITGAGDKAFAVGADITEFKAMSPTLLCYRGQGRGRERLPGAASTHVQREVAA